MTNSPLHAAPSIAQLTNIDQNISKNELQEAARSLNELAKAFPNEPRLFMLGSRLAEAAGNPEGMIRAARMAHQLAPLWPISTMRLADVLSLSHETESAMSLAMQAIQLATTQSVLDAEFLSAAANIAQRLGQHSQALTWLQQAEEFSPADTSIRYKIGLTLIALGKFTDAIQLFTELLVTLPNNPSVLCARRQAALGAKDMTTAIQDSDALLSLDPDSEEHLYFSAIARGETPPTQPASVVALLFNQLARKFDHQMVVELGYKLPGIVAQMIREWHPDLKIDVLDLGCGTGLLGQCLGPMEGFLVGVELAQGMIEQASTHGVYDSFHQVNLLDALLETPGDQYNVIAALDVLNYVGKLESVIPNAHRILMPGGHFIFSCESGTKGAKDYTLANTGRYTHQASYVQRLLEEAHFENIILKDCVLRMEAGQPVQGILVSAEKSVRTPNATDALTAKKNAPKRPKNAKPKSLAQ